MVCPSCGDGDHLNCANKGRDTNTWCDCQHKVRVIKKLNLLEVNLGVEGFNTTLTTPEVVEPKEPS